jgi:hypothetical protein
MDYGGASAFKRRSVHCVVFQEEDTSTHLFEGVNHMGRIVITKKTQGCN